MVRQQGWSDRVTSRVNSGEPTASGALFEYIGATALTVFGAVTGTRYRFAHGGARLAPRRSER